MPEYLATYIGKQINNEPIPSNVSEIVISHEERFTDSNDRYAYINAVNEIPRLKGDLSVDKLELSRLLRIEEVYLE